MTQDDYDDFSRMVRQACRMLSRGAYVPDGEDLKQWFRVLARFPLEAVRYGLDAHMADPVAGRFSPSPADVVGKIEARLAKDGRPGAEEAWALAVQAADEQATVVWTAEMAEAFAVARLILQGGDDVGARMAFREVYVRLVDAARAARLPAAWSVSEGHDLQRRALAVRSAVAQGRLAAPQAESLLSLPAPRADTLAIGQAEAGGMPQAVREALLALKYRLSGGEVVRQEEAANERSAAERRAAAARARLADMIVRRDAGDGPGAGGLDAA